jgi:hypothetical protein
VLMAALLVCLATGPVAFGAVVSAVVDDFETNDGAGWYNNGISTWHGGGWWAHDGVFDGIRSDAWNTWWGWNAGWASTWHDDWVATTRDLVNTAVIDTVTTDTSSNGAWGWFTLQPTSDWSWMSFIHGEWDSTGMLETETGLWELLDMDPTNPEPPWAGINKWKSGGDVVLTSYWDTYAAGVGLLQELKTNYDADSQAFTFFYRDVASSPTFTRLHKWYREPDDVSSLRPVLAIWSSARGRGPVMHDYSLAPIDEATVTVDGDGGADYTTIQAAIDGTTPGLALTINVLPAASAYAGFTVSETLQPDGVGSLVVNGSGASMIPINGAVDIEGETAVTLRNFDMSGGWDAVTGYTSRTMMVVTIEDCLITSSGGDGVKFENWWQSTEGPSVRLTLRNTEITGCPARGVVVRNANPLRMASTLTIEDCYIHDNL